MGDLEGEVAVLEAQADIANRVGLSLTRLAPTLLAQLQTLIQGGVADGKFQTQWELCLKEANESVLLRDCTEDEKLRSAASLIAHEYCKLAARLCTQHAEKLLTEQHKLREQAQAKRSELASAQ